MNTMQIQCPIKTKRRYLAWEIATEASESINLLQQPDSEDEANLPL